LQLGELIFRLRLCVWRRGGGDVRHGTDGAAFRIERAEHAHGAFEQRNVLFAHLLKPAEGKHAPERGLEIILHLVLVTRERLHRVFQVARNQPLHIVAIEADQLAQERDGQQVLPLRFLFHDDLRQHRTGDVIPGLRVIDHEIRPVLHHLAKMVQGHIAARRGVVQPTVGVLLDGDRYGLGVFFFSHLASLPPDNAANRYIKEYVITRSQRKPSAMPNVESVTIVLRSLRYDLC